jgi:hypothetical protein
MRIIEKEMKRIQDPANMICMRQQVRQRFWVETALGIMSAAILVITMLWKDWIEIVFRIDPDAGSGAVEWAFVLAALAATITFSVLARSEWRRASQFTNA